MAIYLILTAATLCAAYTVQTAYRGKCCGTNCIYRGSLKNCAALIAIFTLLTAVSAIRLNVGNDYSNYVEFMHRAFSGAYVPTEPGFNYLTILVYRISGFENYVAVFAIFAAATVFFFLAAIYRQSDDFAMSFMMFMLLGYYFQSISTVRYYLALSVAMYSIRYCLKGDWARFVLLILIGSLFHRSLLVVLVLYPLALIKWRKWMQGLLGAACISCIFLKDVYLRAAIAIYPSYAGTEYMSGGTSYVNIARCLAVIGLAAFVYRRDILGTKRRSFYFYCNLFALLFYTFGSFLPTVSRIAYYLTATQIFYVPMVIEDADERKGNYMRPKSFLKVLTILACLAYFAMYMRHAGDDGVRILPYETFMFHELPATLSERGFG